MPDVWFKMEMDDFTLMSKGYWARRKRDEMNFANVAFIIDAFATVLTVLRPAPPVTVLLFKTSI